MIYNCVLVLPPSKPFVLEKCCFYRNARQGSCKLKIDYDLCVDKCSRELIISHNVFYKEKLSGVVVIVCFVFYDIMQKHIL